MPETIDAWHFCPRSMLTRYDGRPIIVGKALTVAGPVVPCERGLHASERIIDALEYAPNEAVALCRVKLGGEIVPHGNPVDKLAATRRTCLWALDGDMTNRVLRVFARQCALDSIHLWDAPEVVRRYLETGDETIRDVAWLAAWAAARAAARDAARDAAWAAAWTAAWLAARAAAWAAAWAAARDAAWAAAWDVQNERLTALAWAAHNGEPLDVVMPAGYVAVAS